MTRFKLISKLLRKDERGQGMVEYSLILALVSVAAIGTLTALGGNVTSVFTGASNAMKATGP
ncbi:MAG: Flp/Fap pilin component [Cyanobacteria bacterium RYN_339]|nr:Flp/Fap pilin component [Cyanobacteria bacterium RYN_339]